MIPRPCPDTRNPGQVVSGMGLMILRVLPDRTVRRFRRLRRHREIVPKIAKRVKAAVHSVLVIAAIMLRWPPRPGALWSPPAERAPAPAPALAPGRPSRQLLHCWRRPLLQLLLHKR